jgi:predicted Zn-dependent protease
MLGLVSAIVFAACPTTMTGRKQLTLIADVVGQRFMAEAGFNPAEAAVSQFKGHFSALAQVDT